MPDAAMPTVYCPLHGIAHPCYVCSSSATIPVVLPHAAMDYAELVKGLRDARASLAALDVTTEPNGSLYLTAAHAIESLTAARAQANERNAQMVHSLKLIEHATAPGTDGGEHENAYTLARQALSLNKWGVI